MPPDSPPAARFEYERTEMAVPFKLVFYAPSADAANGAAESVFQRLHQINAVLSDYDPESELRRLCDTAGEGKAVPVSDDLWRVLVASLDVAKRSGWAFDPTIGPLVRVWRLARRFEKMPPPDLLERMRALVDYRWVRLAPERHAVELTKRGMRLDFGGIAKGFAVEEALAVLRKRGITRAMIHAGGDLGLGDPPPDRPGWAIGIGAREPKGPPSFYLSLSQTFVANSGDMWQYVVLGGTRYSHIVDPKTGLGLTDQSSVTVIGPNGMATDAMSKVVSVLGPEKGLAIVDQTPGLAAYVIRCPAGKIEVRQSSRWKDLPVVKAPNGRICVRASPFFVPGTCMNPRSQVEWSVAEGRSGAGLGGASHVRSVEQGDATRRAGGGAFGGGRLPVQTRLAADG
jgi:thiamine biosynthesis lipoprotein